VSTNDLRYVSTRGQAPACSFADVLLAGLAPDGGLYMPQAWPRIDVTSFAGKPYADVAFAILKRFVAGDFTEEELRADVDAAYAGFDDPRIAPLSEIGPDLYLLELFHGPTLAFKDIAMQVLGRLFARALRKRGGRATVVAATSGDTGSAAIAALGGLPDIDVFVMHPKGRISEVQRRQMTTSPHANVHNIALEGSFDDAQAIVKDLFADAEFARQLHLTAVNSINFARIAAQCVYYVTATAQLGKPATFVVPTGNFGDVFAGEAAMRMGLPLDRLVVATNANDIMVRALNEGVYEAGSAHQTLSPSMDIQVASNFERALFEASGRDAEWTRRAMADFARERKIMLPPNVRAALAERYAAYRTDDDETLAAIHRVYGETGRLIDPHTAVAMAAARRLSARQNQPMIVLSTAHPAKFPDAIRAATGQIPEPPPRLMELHNRTEKMTALAPDKRLVQAFIAARVAAS
jgi:threonine synthase